MSKSNKPKFRSDIQTKLRKYIWNRVGKPFEFCRMKKVVFGYTNYGGTKGKEKIKQIFNLREFKENGRVMLQKIK